MQVAKLGEVACSLKIYFFIIQFINFYSSNHSNEKRQYNYPTEEFKTDFFFIPLDFQSPNAMPIMVVSIRNQSK